MSKWTMTAVAALAGLAAPATANDSVAEMAAGGLVLGQTGDIDMVSEDLFVSTSEIRVRYLFRNRSAKDIRTLVAFPLPERRPLSDSDGDVAWPSDFSTRVDGRPVEMKVERKTVGGATRETWYWEQVFPAERDLVVEHRYTPGAGGNVGTGLVTADFRRSAEGKAMIRDYCIDRAFLAGIDRMARRAGGDYPTLPEERVSYILKTGANWRSPIARFRLVVDKGAPDNLLSFCGEGVRKISPTRFEMVKTNWRPQRDLRLLIVKPQPPAQD